MKTQKLILLILLLMGLCGCGVETTPEQRIQVTVVETEGCGIEQNGIWVTPGENAVFLLDMEPGVSVAATDYSGGYSTRLVDGKLELTLESVRYPTRVGLTLTSIYSTITYLPNEGEGTETVVTYDLSRHKRPNTSIGTDLFSRDGYTLVCWNTEPDGSGIRVGLGSRVSAGMKLTLYAQWVQWTEEDRFHYVVNENRSVTIVGYLGDDETVVIPERNGGYDVTAIAANTFDNCPVRHLIIPKTMERVEISAFANCPLETVLLFDNIQFISDASFENCDELRTLYINAIEAPWGYAFRKESAYADKVDLLICNRGRRKMVFYGGCSVWYNLDGAMADRKFGEDYAIVNMGLNGTVNSAVQMQIMEAFLEEGDILLHTLELTSRPQLLSDITMDEGDEMLWCGLEYNWDLFSLVDLRSIDGEFDSLVSYLDKRETQTTYTGWYTDEQGREYLDEYGCVPFDRSTTREDLGDEVQLDPAYVDDAGMERLLEYYESCRNKGVTVYVSYACVNMNAVPPEQQGNVALMDERVKDAVTGVISDLADYLYVSPDFYDTNYHLRSQVVSDNTVRWLRDLKAQMVLDGLWKEPNEDTAAP